MKIMGQALYYGGFDMTLQKAIEEAKNYAKAEIAYHLPEGKKIWEVEDHEIHACVMVYIDDTSNAWHRWTGKWEGTIPVCFCGYEFRAGDFISPDEAGRLLKQLR